MESLDDKINVLKGNNSQHRGNIKRVPLMK